ncbi:hypothetical protein A2160_01050 [Candidatus Beckwithbacteria bacterium RBG_13_42_9]|uniref:HD domain-containing protein n=1 Tax=Candidatus Beckwithbacteria bacterium RBG_13_42_9 TaxID=1797457 RepID=A0A1F5E3Q9_9BACT|nr:MAG: hypothetical protein A2160_01050 [Candidatus Beckwithbacteria bacterium RBG_13_42_9]
MKVSQVYQIYQTPKNLQGHQARTAALASIILESWTGVNLDKAAIVKACAVHDLAKPITFNLAKQAQFGMSEIEIKKLRQLQNELKAKYGNSEHQATIGICKEVGCSQSVVRLVDNLEWSYLPRLLKANDFESLIPIYCDMRIGPKGILLLRERLDDLKKRANSDDFEDNVKNGQALEELIKKNVEINLDLITEAQIEKRLKDLLDVEMM